MTQNGKMIRQLGLFDAIMIMMGIVIGSGIFFTTGLMAQSLPSTGLILLAWLVGGVLTLAGAMTYAELGAAFPDAGGQYVYLNKAYGPMVGFLFGWITFTVYMSGGIAGLAVAFSEYFSSLVGFDVSGKVLDFNLALAGKNITLSLSWGQFVAVAAILLLSICNYLGVRWGTLIQNVSTTFKIGALSLFVVLGLILTGDSSIPVSFASRDLGNGSTFLNFGLALVMVAWAFDGWNNVNFVAGEIKECGRILPRALIWGTIGVTTVYFLTNLVYIKSIPLEEMAGMVRVAEASAQRLFGDRWSLAVVIAVVVSTFGALNGSIFAGPRVYYAMARDGLFFRSAGRVHPRFGTPAKAIVFQGVWASILALSGSFEQLITYTMFVAIIFWIIAALAVFRLRKKYPKIDRPYRVWGYPLIPILFIVASAGILVNTLIEKPLESFAGIGLTLAGIPVYILWKRK